MNANRLLYRLISGGLLTIISTLAWADDQPTPWWSDSLEAVLRDAGENQPQLLTALRQCPPEQRVGLAFLIENMPARDLKSLQAEELLENCRLAYQVRQQVAWGKKIPEPIFLNDVLPHANVDETRDGWRKAFHEKFLAIAQACDSPSQAAHELNKQIFRQLNVRYSTQRKKANQSPTESMEIGLASCTGLSILLVDACRSVGVPARLAGIALWSNKRGNHTWVEVWDDGWHFTGAAEPSNAGLDHGWFEHDASLAQKDKYEHAIFAVSYRKTGTPFPLVWAPRDQSISAINVTDRYQKAGPQDAETMRLMVRVWSADRKQRLAAKVLLLDDTTGKTQAGTSHDESHDTNDILSFTVPADHHLQVHVTHPQGTRRLSLQAKPRTEKILEVALPASP